MNKLVLSDVKQIKAIIYVITGNKVVVISGDQQMKISGSILKQTCLQLFFLCLIKIVL